MTTPPTAPAQPQPDLTAGPQLAAVLLAGGGGRRLGGVDKARLRRGESTLLQHWTTELTRREIPTVVVGSEDLRADLPQHVLLTREEPPMGGPAAAVRAGVLALEAAGVLGEAGSESQAGAGGEVSVARETGTGRETRPVRPASVLLAAVDVVSPGPLLDWLLAQPAQLAQPTQLAEPAHVAQPADLAEAAGVPGAEEAAGVGAERSAVIPVDADGRDQRLASLIPAAELLAAARALSAEEVEGSPLRVLLESIPAVHPQMPEQLGQDVDTPEDAQRLQVELGQAERTASG